METNKFGVRVDTSREHDRKKMKIQGNRGQSDTGGLESSKTKKKGKTNGSLKKKIQITEDNNFLIFRDKC